MIGRTKKRFRAYNVMYARNEHEKHLNSNNSTKVNINKRIRAICIQDSGLPGYKHNYFQTTMGCSKKNDIIIRGTMTGTTRAYNN